MRDAAIRRAAAAFAVFLAVLCAAAGAPVVGLVLGLAVWVSGIAVARNLTGAAGLRELRDELLVRRRTR
jgi:uncharacterized oligopeptide transporter (OPT) family protein